MILSNKYIKQAIESGKWKYQSMWYNHPKIGVNSMDITLSPYFAKLEKSKTLVYLYLNEEDISDKYIEWKEEDNLLLLPNQSTGVILGSAAELIDCSEPLEIDGKLRYFVQHYEGRSTLGRLGIMSHVTAGFGDYGFNGAFTLELKNVNNIPIRIPIGSRIGQIYFTEITEPEGKYEGYEQHDFKPQIPRLGKGRL